MLKIIIPIYLFLLLSLEGLAIVKPRWLIIPLIAIFPLLGILNSSVINSRIVLKDVLRKRQYLFYLIFLIFTVVSFLLTPKNEDKTEIFFCYVTVFFVIISLQRIREQIDGNLLLIIYSLSYLFCVYSLATNIYPSFLAPEHGYQFISSRFYSHNHLGDFLILPLIINFYKLVRGKLINAFHIIIFTPFLLLSYSRSAYLALVAVLILILWFYRRKILNETKRKVILTFFLLFISVTIFMFFAVVREAKGIPVLGAIHSKLEEFAGLKRKLLDGRRLEYAEVSLQAFLKKPLLGVGPGNYIEASKEFLEYKYKTHTAHNIFLDILIENGILAMIFFILFVYKSLKHKSKDIYFFMVVGLLINFQFDYTYRIYSLFFLFIILLGLLKDNDPTRINGWF